MRKESTSFTLPIELKDRLREAAKKKGVSMSVLAEQILKTALDEQKSE